MLAGREGVAPKEMWRGGEGVVVGVDGDVELDILGL